MKRAIWNTDENYMQAEPRSFSVIENDGKIIDYVSLYTYTDKYSKIQYILYTDNAKDSKQTIAVKLARYIPHTPAPTSAAFTLDTRVGAQEFSKIKAVLEHIQQKYHAA